MPFDMRQRVNRKGEERSCNYVNAVCAQSLKKLFPSSPLTGPGRGLIGPRCTEDENENYQLNMPTKGQLSSNDACNARLPDMPYMLHNPMAEQHGWGTALKELSYVAHRLIHD